MSQEWIYAHWGLKPTPTDVEIIEGVACALDGFTGRLSSVDERGASLFTEIDLKQGTTLLTPGLINAHTHLELFSPEPISVAADQTMVDWLLAVIEHRQADRTVDLISQCHQSLMRLICSGTTCVNDITRQGASLVAMDQIGMRGVVSPEFFVPGDFPNGPSQVEQIEETIQFWRTLAEAWQDHPLIQLGLSPHSPYNVTMPAWQQVVAQTQPFLVHSHIAETQLEMDYFKTGESDLKRLHETLLGFSFEPSGLGQTPVEAYAEMFNDQTVLAHGVVLTPRDIELLAQRGVRMVHCPQSNQWISGSEAKMPYRALKEAGVRVALGTDSALSCPKLDLRVDARLAQQLHGLSNAEILRLVTVDGAEVLGQADSLGRLTPGYQSDLVLWWNPHIQPEAVTDPLQLWLDPQTEVVMVWINGRILLDRCASCWSD